jgi:hypothetical protein
MRLAVQDIRAGVLGALRAASDIQWTDELLFKIVDKGEGTTMTWQEKCLK